jgi:peptidoglycan/xylan/chitin deacetylase (PgdA/CDA1 family)
MMHSAFDPEVVIQTKPKVTPWPEGVRCVCLLTYDVDVDSTWIRQGLTEPVNLSIGQCEPKVGTPQILDLLDEFDIKTTFFVPGWVAERYTPMVDDIVRRGHTIGHHGYRHEPGTEFKTREQEVEIFERGIESLVKIVGRRPTGYRAPAWEFSSHTLSILHQLKFDYTSDLMDTLVPAYHTVDGSVSQMLNLPVHWVLDDLAHFSYNTHRRLRILSCRQVEEIYREEFCGIYGYGGLFTLTMHPQGSGRPSRILMMRQFINYISSFPGVWITTPDEVVKYWRQAHSR